VFGIDRRPIPPSTKRRRMNRRGLPIRRIPSRRQYYGVVLWSVLFLSLGAFPDGGTAAASPDTVQVGEGGDDDTGRGDGDGGPTNSVAVTLIKVGGSSITHKATRESVDTAALDWFARAVAGSVDPAFRYDGDGVAEDGGTTHDERACRANATATSAVVVVHGAGSFGHHTAKAFGLGGHTEPPPLPSELSLNETERKYAMRGLAETRLSVQKLNGMVVSALVDQGISAVGISPCFGVPSLQAHGGDDRAASVFREVVHSALRAGLVPVLHGDACLYGRDGDDDNDDGGGAETSFRRYSGTAGILSGDLLMEMLGRAPWGSRAVFLTDVAGVYTSDPKTDATARLVREIGVDSSGEIRSADLSTSVEASGSSHRHDVTGGFKVGGKQ